MAKMYYNYSGLQGTINNLDSAVNKYNQAINILNSASIPNYFSGMGEIRDIVSSIASNRNRANNLIDWIRTSNSRLDNIINEISVGTSNISVNEVKRRTTIVRDVTNI